MSSSNRSFVFALLILGSLGLSACGSSGNGGSGPSPEAGLLTASAQGLFSGDLVSNSGTNAGVLNLKVESNGSASAILSGTVEGEISEISLQTGRFEKEIAVPGLASGVLLKANFDGRAWAGTLSVPSSPTVYNFSLLPSEEVKMASEVQRLAPEGLYSGKFSYPSGGKRAARLVVAATSHMGERLLALFTPQTAASVQIVYDGGATESVTNAVWNSEQRTLMATGPAMTSLGAPQLQCVYDELENLDCVLALGKQSVGKGKFVRQAPPAPSKPKPTPVAQPKPVATPAPKPAATPVATPSPIAAPVPVKNFGTERLFVGKAVFKNAGKASSRDVSLEVTLLSTDVEGPVAARVVFRARASQVGAVFRTSLYDSVEKTLKAEQRLSAGALAGSLVLSCRDFNFKASPYQFTCDYETATGVVGSFIMSGK